MRRCIERKRYPDGKEVSFECELLALEDGFGILKYVIDREWRVHGLVLPPGTVTYAFYWTDRPYNLYWWVDESGAALGYYFNIGDSVELSVQEFVWRDLIIDLLVLPDGSIQVIDKHEVPDTLNDSLKIYLETAVQQIIQEHPAIITEAALALNRHHYN